MSVLAVATLVGFAAGGLGSLGGGFLTVALGRLGEKWLSMMMGFSAGIMIAVVCFDLMPEAIEAGSMFYGLLGLMIGALCLLLVDVYIPHSHGTSEEPSKSAKFLRTGVLLAIGMTMHSIPEGMAIGASYAIDDQHGLRLAILIAIQKLPEGMAVCTPIILGGINRLGSLGCTLAAGLPVGIGAFIGILAGNISPLALSLSLGFAAGAMLFITCDSLIPDAQDLASGHSATISMVVGVITGILISSLLI